MKNPKYLIVYIALAIFLFLFLLIGVNTQLIFHLQQLGFSLNGYTIKEYLQIPGGITEYFSAFLFQFSIFNILGSLVYSLLIIVLIGIVQCVSFKKDVEVSVFSLIFPAVLATVLVANYAFPIFYIVIIIVQFILFKLLLKALTLFDKSSLWGLIVLLIFFPIAYFLLGGIYFLVLVGSSILYLTFNFKKKYLPVVILIAMLGISIPYIAVQQSIFITISDSYFKVKPYFSNYNANWILSLLIYSLPIILIINKSSEFLSSRLSIKKRFHLIAILGSISIVIFLGLISLNKKEKQKYEIDYLSFNGDWNKVIELATASNLQDRLTQFHVNRALFHLGKLPTEMFNYNQNWSADGLILTRHFENQILLPSTQLFLDFGYINEAIHWGNEAISQNENSPQIIEQLIVANIIAGKFDHAKTYINSLMKFPFFKEKAISYEKIIDGNNLNSDWIAKRNLMPVNDFMVNRNFRDSDLKYILIDRPKNKMVYEYLMAYCLLNNDLATLYNYVELGRKFYNGKVPRLYQEAVSLYLYQLNMEGKDVPVFDFDEDVVADFTDFIMIMFEYKDDTKAAKPALRKKYKNTFWYYVYFNKSSVEQLKNN